MTDATVGFLLENLKEILVYNADLIGGVQENVKDLCDDLDTLRGFIKEYTKEERKNDILKAVVKEIRNVVNEAEDAIETVVVETAIQEQRSFIRKALHMFDHQLKIRRVAKEIQGVREKVKDIYKNKAKFGLEALQIDEESNRNPARKRSSPAVEEDNVVGFDDEAHKIVELLTEEPQELQVISIIGTAGQGKTTLSKKVLNDPKIEYKFSIRAFVHVSQDYRRREVFLSILSTFTHLTPELNLMSDDLLAESIRIHLKTIKYLFIIDDVWSREDWDSIKIAFPNNNKYSRLLITTRSKNVALHANPSIRPHDLRSLTLDESQKLLRLRVYGVDSCPADLEEYVLQIANKCGGLPLAVVVIAGILLNKRDRTSWWMKVADNVNDYFSRDQEQSNDVTALSYTHLPFHLKPCFLYLGVFCEESEIPVWKLLRLWISEGFIHSNGEARMEDRAEEYLEELVERDLVMVGKRKSDGKLKTCRISTTLRGFCKKMALEETLFQEIKDSDMYAMSSPSLDNCRRLCVNSKVKEYLNSKPSGEHVRSILAFPKEEAVFDPDILFIPDAFTLLRILDIQAIKFSSFPDELCNLVLLKYLALSGEFEMVPEEMSNLWNIQTFISETTGRVLHVEANIWRLLHLRHFHSNVAASFLCPPSKSHKDRQMHGDMQTLSLISTESCQKDVFERTPHLKKLGICGKLSIIMEGSGECSLFDYLYKLESLENLKLMNDDPDTKLQFLPHSNSFPSKLTKLTLSNTRLDWKHIRTIGELHNLEVLKLKDNAFEGETWETEGGGFYRLKVLFIGKTNLIVWKASAHHFPLLKTLTLKNCDSLEAVPSGLAEIPSLQAIELLYANSSAASSARKVQILKLQIQAKKGIRGNGFKLSVYPPDQ